MRLSKFLLNTLKKAPVNTNTTSEKLLLRSGMIYKRDENIYSFMPLGCKLLDSLKDIIESNMGKKEIYKISTSSLSKVCIKEDNPIDIKFSKSNDLYICDNKDKLFIKMINNLINSYKKLPLRIYETEKNYKNSKKNKLGLIDSNEDMINICYCFDKDKESSFESRKLLLDTYKEILDSLSLEYRIIENEDSRSIKFIVEDSLEEEDIVTCKNCSYGDRQSFSSSIPEDLKEDELKPMKKIETPDIKTIKELGEYFNVPFRKFTKNIIYTIGNKTVAVMVRGDKEIDEAKVLRRLERDFKIKGNLELASERVVREATSAEVGFAGPIGLKADILLVDEEVVNMNNYMAGANETGYHYENINYDRDYKGIVGDFRKIISSDKCKKCSGDLNLSKSIIVGEIENIQDDIVKNMGAAFLNKEGKEDPFILTKGYLDLYKLICTVVDKNNDENGIVWPKNLSPYKVIITVANVKNESQIDKAEEIYRDLKNNRIKVILDDRKERAGVKFKDADLIGIPIRITIGKNINEGKVEIKLRDKSDAVDVEFNHILEKIKSAL